MTQLYANIDPSTSRTAAEGHEASGRLASHRALILAAVQANPGCTSAELAEFASLERHEASRRLADLKNLGAVRQNGKRTCAVKGTRQVCWWEVTEAVAQRELF